MSLWPVKIGPEMAYGVQFTGHQQSNRLRCRTFESTDYIQWRIPLTSCAQETSLISHSTTRRIFVLMWPRRVPSVKLFISEDTQKLILKRSVYTGL